MAHSLWLRLEYWKDGNWFVGRLAQVPGVFSQEATLDELEDNIRDTYQLMLAEQTQAPGYVLKRRGSRLTSISMPLANRSAPVTRHVEVPDSLCNIIRRQLGLPPAR
jgi:predicted RNase H-like HicB family nuclease